MPKPQGTTTTAPDQSEDQAKDNKPEAKEVSLADKKLPALMGELVTTILEDPRKVNDCAHVLQHWHDLLPVEDRAELVKENKKVLERAKQATEFLYSQYLMISQKDTV